MTRDYDDNWTNQADDEIDRLEQASTPTLNQRTNLLEPWNAIFQRPPRPQDTSTLDTENDDIEATAPTGPRRLRQQRLHAIDPDSNEAYGDTMKDKQKGLNRFYFINTNGISHHQGMLDFYEILQSMKDHDIDIFGFSETNLNTLQPEVRKRLEDISQEFYGNSILATSTSTRPTRTAYQPGGTCTGISQELCGRYQASGSDPHGLGRWSYIQMTGKHGRSLIVITAYRVCEANISTIGASTTCHQQWHLLRQKGDTKPQPRKRFITDLCDEIKKWQRAGAEIILGGDFNEKMGDSPDGLSQLVTRCALVDPHAIHHGTDPEPIAPTAEEQKDLTTFLSHPAYFRL
jgi:hypothetical protein